MKSAQAVMNNAFVDLCGTAEAVLLLSICGKFHRDLTIPQHCVNMSTLDSGIGCSAHAEIFMAIPETTDHSQDRKLIFVVEDDPDVSRLIEHNLRLVGYDVSTFFSGTPVVASAEAQPPSLFLLDIMLPGMSGFDLCREIRGHRRLAQTPIIFLSARTQEPDRIHAFDLGGDAYITKPFSPRELIVRVRNMLRNSAMPALSETIQVGGLEIDPISMTVRVDGQAVLTTAREFRLLEYMARYSGRVFTRSQLLDAVWKENLFVTPRSIDVFMRRLREKIEANPQQPRYLKTVRGVGYRFEGSSLP